MRKSVLPYQKSIAELIVAQASAAIFIQQCEQINKA